MNTRHWTPARVRKALLCPKPRHALARAVDFENGTCHRRPEPLERRALRALIDNSDLLDVPTPDEHGELRDRWLLVRAPSWLLDWLASFEAGLDDLEPDDIEPDVDAEPEIDHDDDCDLEEDGRELRTERLEKRHPEKASGCRQRPGDVTRIAERRGLQVFRSAG